MSYQQMDHARWVEGNNRARRSMYRKPRSDCRKGFHAAPETLSEFEAKVMDILGMAGGGIYNCPIPWNAVQWKGWGNGLAVPWKAYSHLATFDRPKLTCLVFLCHEARIRFEIRLHGPGMFLLCFWPRSHVGGYSGRHPNLDEAVAAFREYLPADHRIIYRAPSSDEEAA
jgi:hypothetical protein